MNTTQIGGREAYRANALALRLELGLPAADTETAAITFGGITVVSLPVLEGMAHKAVKDGQDAIVAVYDREDDETPAWYFLVLRMLAGVCVVKVHPASVGKDKPLVLVTEDGTRQFEIDGRGALREIPVDATARQSRARKRAANRIAAKVGMFGAVLNTDAWEATPFAIRVDGATARTDKAAV